LKGSSHHGNLETGRKEVKGRPQKAFNWTAVGHGGKPLDHGTRIYSHGAILLVPGLDIAGPER
jgi:hypothetical protein